MGKKRKNQREKNKVVESMWGEDIDMDCDAMDGGGVTAEMEPLEQKPVVEQKKKGKKNGAVKQETDAASEKPRDNGEEMEEGKDNIAVDAVKAEVKEEEWGDCQREFVVLGQDTFVPLNKINVTSSWISGATVFPAEIGTKTVHALDSVSGLPEKLKERVASTIKNWFPVQKAVLPLLLSQVCCRPSLRPRDLAISAPTGSGKTLCYVLPILAAVGERPRGRLTALVVAPVQTLVAQVEQELSRFNACGARIVALSAASDIDKERHRLNEGVDVVVATPGRLAQHLQMANTAIQMDTLRVLVVDEADRMGTHVRAEWLELVERRSGGQSRAVSLRDMLASRAAPHKILLSATLSKDVEELHMWNLHRPCLFRATVSSVQQMSVPNGADHVTGRLALPSNISHRMLESQLRFFPLLVHLQLIRHPWKKVLVFTNQRMSSFRLARLLQSLAGTTYQVDQFTAELFGRRRHKTLQRFKDGKTRVLICSDVLSRGVDVEGIDCVVNYDIPEDDRLFVHRAGRTGRAGNKGQLLTLVDADKKRVLKRMLTKHGLWINVEEETAEESSLQPHMDKYRHALDELKSAVGPAEAVAPSAKSGLSVDWDKRKGKRKMGCPPAEKRKWKSEKDDSGLKFLKVKPNANKTAGNFKTTE